MPYPSRKRYSRPVKRQFKQKVARVVRSIAEKKHCDHLVVFAKSIVSKPQAVSWELFQTKDTIGTAEAQYLNILGQGTEVFNRIGERVAGVALDINLHCRMQTNYSTYFPGGSLIRIALVWDDDPSGATYNSAVQGPQIWQTYYDPGVTTAVCGPSSPRNTSFNERFKVLRYFDMPMSPGAACPCVVRSHIPLREAISVYKGPGVDDAAIKSGRLSLWGAYVTPNNADLDTTPVIIEGSIRYTFTDL